MALRAAIMPIDVWLSLLAAVMPINEAKLDSMMVYKSVLKFTMVASAGCIHWYRNLEGLVLTVSN